MFQGEKLSQKCSTPPCIGIIFMKGNNFCNFLFVSLKIEAILKWGIHFNEREQILSLRVDPHWDS